MIFHKKLTVLGIWNVWNSTGPMMIQISVKSFCPRAQYQCVGYGKFPSYHLQLMTELVLFFTWTHLQFQFFTEQIRYPSVNFDKNTKQDLFRKYLAWKDFGLWKMILVASPTKDRVNCVVEDGVAGIYQGSNTRLLISKPIQA